MQSEPFGVVELDEGTCAACRFYVNKRAKSTSGQCRRYPPQVGPDCDYFPVVAHDEWCGEFQPRERPLDQTKEGVVGIT